MRHLLASVCVVGLVLGFASAGRADEVKDVLDKATKAHGGEEKLNKLKAARTKTKGTIELGGGLAFTQEVIYQLPDKFKESTDLNVMGNQVRIVTIFIKDQGSIHVDGKEQELTDAIKTELKEASHAAQIGRLVPLKKAPFTLSTLGEVKVHDKPAVGLKVSAKGFRDIDLWFDKESGRIVKVERRLVDPISGQEVTEERIVTEYQKVDDMPVAKKVLVNRDGKKYLEVEIVEIKFVESIDDNEFANP